MVCCSYSLWVSRGNFYDELNQMLGFFSSNPYFHVQMDFQNRVGSKKGSKYLPIIIKYINNLNLTLLIILGGGQAGWAESNAYKRERQRQLALETINFDKDPYVFRNHVGHLECRLCSTTHVSEGSYLSHTQGRKHQTNLAKRAAKDQKQQLEGSIADARGPTASTIKKHKFVKTGRPGYKIAKIRDPVSKRIGLKFQLHYEDIKEDIVPRHRFMSCYEQKQETPELNTNYRYLVIAAEPCETVAFKIPSKDLAKGSDGFWTYWDKDTKEYYLQLFFDDV